MSTDIITVTLQIDGMTCVNCENRIERTLSKFEGLEEVKVSYSKGTAKVSFRPNLLSLEQIEKAIENKGYHVRDTKKQEEKKVDIYHLITITAILLSIFVLINRFGGNYIFNLFPVAKEGMGYGMLFVIGLLSSVHCVAMCGGICLSQSVSLKTHVKEAKGFKTTLRPSMLYNIGRVISYTLIGGIVGALGTAISFTGRMKGLVQILAGIFMVIMGLNILGIFPWLRKVNPRIPKIFAAKIYSRNKSNRPFYIGILNGLMPCGPLQAMQLYALSTESPIKGAFSMLLFSIGTVPLMFAFGAFSSLVSNKFTNKMISVSAVLVMILGLFMFSSGTALSGFYLPVPGQTTQKSAAAKVEDGVQTVTTNLASGSYEPITVQKGIPVRWTIKAENSNINGCNNSMIVPKYNLQVDLKPGDNIIEFTPTESGTIPYSCWMGMIRSNITVID